MRIWREADTYAESLGFGATAPEQSTGLAVYANDQRLRLLFMGEDVRRHRLLDPGATAEWLNGEAEGLTSWGPWSRSIVEGVARYTSPDQVGTPWTHAAAVHWNGALEVCVTIQTRDERDLTWFDPSTLEPELQACAAWLPAVVERLALDETLLVSMELSLSADTAGARRTGHVSAYEVTTSPRSRMAWSWRIDDPTGVDDAVRHRLAASVGLMNATEIRGNAGGFRELS